MNWEEKKYLTTQEFKRKTNQKHLESDDFLPFLLTTINKYTNGISPYTAEQKKAIINSAKVSRRLSILDYEGLIIKPLEAAFLIANIGPNYDLIVTILKEHREKWLNDINPNDRQFWEFAFNPWK